MAQIRNQKSFIRQILQENNIQLQLYSYGSAIAGHVCMRTH